MLSVDEIIKLLNTVPYGYRSPADDFFIESNRQLLPKYKKLGVISVENETNDKSQPSSSAEYFCNIPGCELIFKDAAAYQTHYNSVHRYLCSVCRRSLPTAHLLDLHLSERHDSYFAILVERSQPMYSCFLQECKQKMLNQQERKDHCIRVHKFPGNYRFEQLCGKAPNSKIEGQKSQKKGANKLTSNAMEISEVDRHMLEGKTFSFGHPKEKTFDARNKLRTKDSFKDLHLLKDALDEIEK